MNTTKFYNGQLHYCFRLECNDCSHLKNHYVCPDVFEPDFMFCVNCYVCKHVSKFRKCFFCSDNFESIQVPLTYYCQDCDDPFLVQVPNKKKKSYACANCTENKDIVGIIIDQETKLLTKKREERELRKKITSIEECELEEVKTYHCKVCDEDFDGLYDLINHYEKNKHIIRQVEKDFEL